MSGVNSIECFRQHLIVDERAESAISSLSVKEEESGDCRVAGLETYSRVAWFEAMLGLGGGLG
jgi:hypothetical protein